MSKHDIKKDQRKGQPRIGRNASGSVRTWQPIQVTWEGELVLNIHSPSPRCRVVHARPQAIFILKSCHTCVTVRYQKPMHKGCTGCWKHKDSAANRVDQGTENLGVGGSSPPSVTILSHKNNSFVRLSPLDDFLRLFWFTAYCQSVCDWGVTGVAQSCACGSHVPWFDTTVVTTKNQSKNSARATFLFFASQIVCPHCTAVHRRRMTGTIFLSYSVNKP